MGGFSSYVIELHGPTIAELPLQTEAPLLHCGGWRMRVHGANVEALQVAVIDHVWIQEVGRKTVSRDESGNAGSSRDLSIHQKWRVQRQFIFTPKRSKDV